MYGDRSTRLPKTEPIGDGGQAMVVHDFNHMFYTYVLKSLKDNELYIGYSDNLKRRIVLHSQGKVRATKGRLPIVLVYYEACISSKNAIKREKIKTHRFSLNACAHIGFRSHNNNDFPAFEEIIFCQLSYPNFHVYHWGRNNYF